jgi:hypothetical protein
VRLASERVAAALRLGNPVEAAVAAEAFLLSNASRRHAIADALSAYLKEGWATAFATRLSITMEAQGVRTAERLSRRHGAALLLFASVPALAVAGGASLLGLAGPALASRRPEIVAAVVAALERISPAEVLAHLQNMAGRPADVLAPAWAAIARAMNGKQIDQGAAWQGVSHTDEAVRVGMWRALAASATPMGTLATLWNQVFDAAVVDNPLVRTAMSSPDALATLARSGITPEQIAARLAERPFLVGC